MCASYRCSVTVSRCTYKQAHSKQRMTHTQKCDMLPQHQVNMISKSLNVLNYNLTF